MWTPGWDSKLWDASCATSFTYPLPHREVVRCYILAFPSRRCLSNQTQISATLKHLSGSPYPMHFFAFSRSKFSSSFLVKKKKCVNINTLSPCVQSVAPSAGVFVKAPHRSDCGQGAPQTCPLLHDLT